jgi:hypothetical protein
MKTSRKWIVFLLGLFTGILCLTVIVWFAAWHTNSKTFLKNPDQQPIPSLLYSQRLVPLGTVQGYKTVFKSEGKFSKPYDGGIIRNIDVLLSLGLNNMPLYQSVKNERISLKITMGVNDTGAVKMYAHPVLVDTTNNKLTVTADLYFDQYGNLWVYNNGNPTPFNPGQSFFSAPKAAGSLKAISNPANELYQIDLNNPCPPCTTNISSVSDPKVN